MGTISSLFTQNCNTPNKMLFSLNKIKYSINSFNKTQVIFLIKEYMEKTAVIPT